MNTLPIPPKEHSAILPETRRCYVYMLRIPQMDEPPRYIGKGTGEPRARINAHATAGTQRVREFIEEALDVGWKREHLITVVCDQLTPQEAIDLEAYLITRWGFDHDDSGVLFNSRSRGQLQEFEE